MAAYDNLLANVPTDLWIGGKWKKSSDGARFDVIDPATEQQDRLGRERQRSTTPRPRSTPRRPRSSPGPRASRASAAKSCARPTS